MNKKILVVDDDEGILDAMQVLLESEGYGVEISSDGQILEKLNKNNLPDVILLDVLLSGKDGRQICRALKNKGETKNVPIIMVSAHPRAEDEVMACGANDFLAKPFQMEELLQKLVKYI